VREYSRHFFFLSSHILLEASPILRLCSAIHRIIFPTHVSPQDHPNTLILLLNIPSQCLEKNDYTNTIVDVGYLQHPVVSSFTPTNFKNFTWGLIVEIDQSEVLQPIYALAWAFLLWGLIAIAVVLLLGLIFSRYLTHHKR